MTHKASEVLYIENCLQALALNHVKTNCGTMNADDVESAVILAYLQFIPLLGADYGHIPRKESITDEMLQKKV